LLRIGQEALTNIIKHSEATLAKIDLDYGPQNIVLRIEDNGKGFIPEDRIGPHEGHFGLLGVSERTKRLRGQVSLTSAPGKGTTVRVEIPLDPGPDLLALGRAAVASASAETNVLKAGDSNHE
jgi:signal transduction histidine kinase